MSTAITTTGTQAYGEAALSYLAKGLSPIPTPPGGAKAPVPTGYTGYLGIDAPYADVDSWIEGVNGKFNARSGIAIRMPRGVMVDGREHWGIAIDVDAYKGKRGAETLAAWRTEAGVDLPATWSATSRGADSPSRKYLFLVPAGTKLLTAKDGCELIQFFHRYVYVAPSLNGSDDMRPVAWYDETGTERHYDDLPEPAAWPVLPPQWLDVLRDGRPEQGVLVLSASEHADTLASFSAKSPCKGMRTAISKALDVVHAGCDSRHDAMLKAVGGILRQAERGCDGFRDAIRQAEDAFVAAVAGDRRGGADEAQREFGRMVLGPRGLGMVLANPTVDKGCKCGIHGDDLTDEFVRTSIETAVQDWQVMGYADDLTLDTLAEIVDDPERFRRIANTVPEWVTWIEQQETKPVTTAVRTPAVAASPAPRLQAVPDAQPEPEPTTVEPEPTPTNPLVQPAAEARKMFDPRYSLDLVGNRDRFTEHYGTDNVAIVTDAKAVRTWRGIGAWETDYTGSHVRWLAEELSGVMLAQGVEFAALTAQAVQKAGEDEERVKTLKAALKAYQAHVKASRGDGMLSGLVKSIRSHRDLEVKSGLWDQGDDLVNVANGTIELHEDGSVTHREHRRTDRLTQMAAVAYDPAATCPRFLEYLEWAVPDPAIRRLLRALAGITLVGGNPRQLMVFLIGPPRNGKSTLINLLGLVLGNKIHGEFAYSHPFTLADMRPKASGGSPGLVKIMDKKYAFTVESDDGIEIPADMIKKFTGGDHVSTKDNYATAASVSGDIATFTAWAGTNKPPTITGADRALFERIIAVPFEQYREQGQRTAKLAEKLYAAEASGVLNWMLEGYHDVSTDITVLTDLPQDVIDCGNRLRQDINIYARFIADNCEPCPGGTKECADCSTSAALWDEFRAYCIEQNEKLTTQTKFSRAITELGYASNAQKIGGKTAKVRAGLRVRPVVPLQRELAGLGKRDDDKAVDRSLGLLREIAELQGDTDTLEALDANAV